MKIPREDESQHNDVVSNFSNSSLPKIKIRT